MARARLNKATEPAQTRPSGAEEHEQGSPSRPFTRIDLEEVARQFIAYYTDGTSGCRNCGGTPHSMTCFVKRFEAALAAPPSQENEMPHTRGGSFPKPDQQSELPRLSPVYSERLETGTVKCDDDWTGVFIRGDNALLGYAPSLRAVLATADIPNPFEGALLTGLCGLLELCAEGKTQPQRVTLLSSVRPDAGQADVSPAPQAETSQLSPALAAPPEGWQDDWSYCPKCAMDRAEGCGHLPASPLAASRSGETEP